ncbi:MAG: DNA internalization-related competence protein ComEC/Rec2 [Pseudomonadota bacterium]|nr:DNA internalization-related competence protein ComEC/Rec2 [Pseudomonadota bacterium]
MGRPLAAPTLALMAGIVCSSRCEVAAAPLLLTLIVICLCLLACMIRKGSKAALFFLSGAFLIVGWLQMNLYLYGAPTGDHVANLLGDEPVTITGIITEAPLRLPEKTDLVVAAMTISDHEGGDRPCRGKVLLGYRGGRDFAYGDAVIARTRLRRVRNFQNPGGYDYERHLRFQGILARGFIADDSRIALLRRGLGNPLRRRLEEARERIRVFVDSRAPFPEREIIKACVLGDQQGIPREIREAFSKTGVSHIIAISGFNMGLVAFFSIFLVRSLLRRFPYLLLRFEMDRVAVLFAIPPVLLYTFIAGAGMSVLRATLMILAFMIALIAVRNRDLYNTLAMAALIVLVFHPPALFDISFQLSFAAVAAILFLAPRLTALLPRPTPSDQEKAPLLPRLLGRLRRQTALFLIVSLSAMIGTMPLIALYFNRISLVAFPANMVIVPILGILAVPAALAAALFLPWLPPLANLCLDLAGMLVMTSLACNDFFASPSWASRYLTTPSILEITAFYLLVYTVASLSPSPGPPEAAKARVLVAAPPWRHYALAVLILFFLVNGLLLHEKGRHGGMLSATAIDVGQGSSTLVRFPGDKVMLIDGGGFPNSVFDVGKFIVAPYLWRERIDAIDIVVLTHPHPDHFHGLLFILRNFSIGEVWTNGDRAISPEYQEFEGSIRERNIPCRRRGTRDEPVVLDGVRIEFLNPESLGQDEPPGGSHEDANDRSLTMRMTFGGVSFLFTGDISGVTEEAIVSRSGDISSALLFAPHHGSGNSNTSRFLEAVKPTAAIISAGYDNPFHLPHPEALARIRKAGAKIYRTDLQGMIRAATDGRELEISPFLDAKGGP